MIDSPQIMFLWLVLVVVFIPIILALATDE